MRNPNFAHALTRDQNAGPPLHKILNPPLDTMLSLEQALENRVHEAGLTQVETSTILVFLLRSETVAVALVLQLKLV